MLINRLSHSGLQRSHTLTRVYCIWSRWNRTSGNRHYFRNSQSLHASRLSLQNYILKCTKAAGSICGHYALHLKIYGPTYVKGKIITGVCTLHSFSFENMIVPPAFVSVNEFAVLLSAIQLVTYYFGYHFAGENTFVHKVDVHYRFFPSSLISRRKSALFNFLVFIASFSRLNPPQYFTVRGHANHSRHTQVDRSLPREFQCSRDK